MTRDLDNFPLVQLGRGRTDRGCGFADRVALLHELIERGQGTAKERTAAEAEIATLSSLSAALDTHAPVAFGVSGGKDSVAGALATWEHLDAIGHRGPRKLIHSDLGRVEWKDSLPTCERLARKLDAELITVRRAAGDMMDRWLVRWANNVERYVELSCVKIILPWSTPSMRFCTSELKTAVMCRELIKRFPGRTILSASGIRRAESPKRAKKPTASLQAKLTSKTHRTRGIDWNPIIEWSHADIWTYIADRGFRLHEAYTKYSLTRVSCVFCIMSSAHDLNASARCTDNHDIYREMVDLEIESTFAFQGDTWLGDVAPHLLSAEKLAELDAAKECAKIREKVEALIPDHLLYEDGWPNVMPTEEEAWLLASVRVEVAAILGIEIKYTTAEAVLARYAELMAEKARRAS